MRAIVTLAAASLLSGCTSAVLLEPGLTVSPYYAIYQLRGDVGLQTDPGGGAPLQNNPREPLRLFGLDHHEDDVGVRAEFGDGFGGLRVDYYRLDMNTSQNGLLPADWGALLATDEVRMRADMDELRIAYLEPIYSTTTTYRDEDLKLRIAVGGEFVHRDLALRAQTDDNMRNQDVKILGETLAAAVRFRAEWQQLALNFDYSISPHLVLSGDFGGVMQDFEVRGSYAIPMRDVAFFAGFRYSTIEADGKNGPLDYNADLRIDGFQFGVTVSL